MREDVKRFWQELNRHPTGRKHIEDAEVLLKTSESVFFASKTNFVVSILASNTRRVFNGVVFITSERVVFSCDSLGENYRESIDLSDILSNSFHTEAGMPYIDFQTPIKAFNILVSDKEFMKTIYEIFEYVRKKYIPKDTHAVVTKESLSSTEELLKWKNLLDIGAITPDEYEAKKKQLLNL